MGLEKSDNKGAKSYKGEVIGDSMAITINFKWLIQILFFTGAVVYGWYQLETRIQTLERNMVLALDEIELHDTERQVAEENHKLALEKQLQEQTVWIQEEFNINPFSWGKKKKRSK